MDQPNLPQPELEPSGDKRPVATAETPDLTILVPALNEENTIGGVMDRLLLIPMTKQIIVMDNGSTDRTPDILKTYGSKIEVLRNENKTGKGDSIRQALPIAKGEVIIIQDADLEYFPEEIPSLAEPILQNEVNVVYGTRFAHGMPAGMALPNKLVNWLLAWTVRILFFKKITDEATCYKAFRRTLLTSMNLECHRFEFCPEVTAKALRRGETIREVPVKYEPRGKDAGKKIRWTDAPEAFWTLLKYRFKA